MTRFSLIRKLYCSFFLIELIILTACSRQPSTPPNVLLIMTDDQGYGDIHTHGNKQLDTPTLDGMREEGARFEHFYVSPVCAPTRASLLTGRYSLRTGVYGVTPGYLTTMRLEEVTMAEALQESGYDTALIGKWHLGNYYPYHPLCQGFDEFYGLLGGGYGNHFNPMLEHNLEKVETEGFITDILTDRAICFIEEHRAGPFFLYLAYNAPHMPYMAPDRYFEKYKACGFDDKTSAIYGMVENIDDNLGRLFLRMDELGISDNTIVLFLTDNGPAVRRFNTGMRGLKGTPDEGGTRVPLFIRWPGHIAPGTVVHELSDHIDILPTVLDLCGINAPPMSLDGKSLVPLLEGRPAPWPDRTLFSTLMWKPESQSVYIRSGSVRTPRWRYVFTPSHQGLFDMQTDPGQKHNILTQEPDVTDELHRKFMIWYEDVTAKDIHRPPIEVGHREAPVVKLSASDAFLHGNITTETEVRWDHRYIRNWTNVEDYAWWEIDVVRGGRYEVRISYLCSPDEAGSRIAVEVGNARIEGTVVYQPIAGSSAFSPLHRVQPRTAVYWDRSIMTLGTLDLTEGRTRLYLRALERTGNEVFKPGSIQLQRLE